MTVYLLLILCRVRVLTPPLLHFEGMLILFGFFRTPKSERLPDQEAIDATEDTMGIDKRYHYRYPDLCAIGLLYYTEIKRRLDHGQSLEYLTKHRHRIRYEVHKQWHQEKYVLPKNPMIFDFIEHRVTETSYWKY